MHWREFSGAGQRPGREGRDRLQDLQTYDERPGPAEGQPLAEVCRGAARLSVQWAPFLFVVWLLAGSVAAQISPGPLARQHQFLDGTIHCTECHRLGGSQPEFKCIGCHSDIGTRVAAKRGLHGSYHIPAGSSQECVRCHSDHNGANFTLIKWDPKKFDHKETGYVLEGKHVGPACNKCHTPERIPAAERPNLKAKDLSKTFLGIPQACVACHNMRGLP